MLSYVSITLLEFPIDNLFECVIQNKEIWDINGYGAWENLWYNNFLRTFRYNLPPNPNFTGEL